MSWLRIWFSIIVTDDGSNSSSLKPSYMNFHITFLAKAAIIFFALKEAWFTAYFNDARWRTAINLTGFAIIQSYYATRNYLLNDFINPTYIGCNWWEQRGGKVTSLMAFCLTKRMESRVQCLLWLSNSTIIRSSLRLLVCYSESLRIFNNRGPFNQLLRGILTNNKFPGGAKIISRISQSTQQY